MRGSFTCSLDCPPGLQTSTGGLWGLFAPSLDRDSLLHTVESSVEQEKHGIAAVEGPSGPDLHAWTLDMQCTHVPVADAVRRGTLRHDA